jgi:hypothetical protein
MDDEGGFTVDRTAKRIRVRLDWSRMLGFDQVRRAPDGAEATRLTKVGGKPAVDARATSLQALGSKIGSKPRLDA